MGAGWQGRIATALLMSCVLGACVNIAPRVRPGQAPAADRVIIAGVAGFDPPTEVGPPPLMVIDAFKVMGQGWMGFTYEPDTQVNTHSPMTGLDVWVGFDPQKPFAFEAPRRPLYLRMIRVYRGDRGTRSGSREFVYLTCTGRKRIDVRPADTHVYAGTLLCEHREEAPVGIRVRNQLDEHSAQLTALVGAPLVPRVGESLDVSPVNDEPVHVASHRPSHGQVTTAVERGAGRRGRQARSASGTAGPATSTALVGSVQLVVNGAQVTPAEFARLAGYQQVDLELDGVRAPLTASGGFTLPASEETRRLDHLVLSGPGPIRRALFVPALEVDGDAAPRCLGALRFAWKNRAEVMRDGVPELTVEDACGQVGFRAPSRAAQLSLPELEDPLPLRLASGLFASAGAELGSGGIGVNAGVGLRYRLLRLNRVGGSLYGLTKLQLGFAGALWTGGLSWGPGLGWWKFGLSGGVGYFRNAPPGPMPVIGFTLTSGLPNYELAIFMRYDQGLGGPYGVFSFGLEASPVGLLGALL